MLGIFVRFMFEKSQNIGIPSGCNFQSIYIFLDLSLYCVRAVERQQEMCRLKPGHLQWPFGMWVARSGLCAKSAPHCQSLLYKTPLGTSAEVGASCSKVLLGHALESNAREGNGWHHWDCIHLQYIVHKIKWIWGFTRDASYERN